MKEMLSVEMTTEEAQLLVQLIADNPQLAELKKVLVKTLQDEDLVEHNLTWEERERISEMIDGE